MGTIIELLSGDTRSFHYGSKGEKLAVGQVEPFWVPGLGLTF